MSTQAIGTILNPDGSARTAPDLAAMQVAITDTSAAFDPPLGTAQPNPDGTFSITYPDGLMVNNYGSRTLSLTIRNRVGRVLYQEQRPDPVGPVTDFGQIRADDTTSWAVSLGLPGGSPKPFFSQGNTVRFLVDNQSAWGYIASRLPTGATHPLSVEILELEFDLPDFNTDPAQETPKIVFAFGALLDAGHLRAVTYPADFRPERRLLDIAAQGVPVRFMINDPQVFDLIPFNTVAEHWPFGLEGQYPDVQRYFSAAGSSVLVQRFPINNFGRVHAKMILIDGKEVVVVASPLIQGYYDTPAHAIDEPKRGTGVAVPIHDTSMAVRGPAVAHMHHTYLIHWNLMRPGDLQEISVTPATPGTGETSATLQLVRSINQGIFNVTQGDPVPLANGERGILEAYLRAIDMATDFLYFENQYFTNETIGNAVVQALLAKPQLRAIFLINVVPDIPFYPRWQSTLIQNMRNALGTSRDRLGFFTIWTHEATPGGPGLGRIMGNYVHSKIGVADNSWATVGSANLDGTSLDFTQGLHAVHSHDWRSHEMNYVIFDGIEGQTTEGSTDGLRRMAWSEHLGLALTDSSLTYKAPSGAAFMTLWRNASNTKIAGLRTNPGVPLKPRVLEFPDPVSPTSGDYAFFLRGLNIPATLTGKTIAGAPTLELRTKVRAFSFRTGTWA